MLAAAAWVGIYGVLAFACLRSTSPVLAVLCGVGAGMNVVSFMVRFDRWLDADLERMRSQMGLK